MTHTKEMYELAKESINYAHNELLRAKIALNEAKNKGLNEERIAFIESHITQNKAALEHFITEGKQLQAQLKEENQNG